MDVSLVESQPPPVRACRACGCTDHDCRQCIERTGAPCFWALPDVCSACATLEQLLERSLDLVRAGMAMNEVSRLTLLASSRASAGMPDEMCMACAAGVAVGHWLHDCPDEGESAAAGAGRTNVQLCLHGRLAEFGCTCPPDTPLWGSRSAHGWVPVCVTGGRVHSPGEPCRCEWVSYDEWQQQASQGAAAATERGAQEPIPPGGEGVRLRGAAAAAAEESLRLPGRDRLQHVPGRGREFWRVSAGVGVTPHPNDVINWSDHGEIAVSVQWDFSGGPALIHAGMRPWVDSPNPPWYGPEHFVILTVTEARFLAHVLHRACYRAEGKSAPMMRAGDDGFRLWRCLADLIGDPALAFDPEVLVSRIVERVNVLEACKMPPDPELGGLVRAAAGLAARGAGEVLSAMRSLAEDVEAIDVRFPAVGRMQESARRLAIAIQTWFWTSTVRSAYEIYVDDPLMIATLLGVSGYGPGVEDVAAWTTSQRRAALDWALLGRHQVPPAPPPAFLDHAEHAPGR